jgi:hypothetical protein
MKPVRSRKLSIATICLGLMAGHQRTWNEDGPYLPVEFARIPKNRRLTLVLFPDAPKVQCPWVETKFKTLEEAIAYLSKQEETTEDNIGFYSSKDESYRCNAIPNILPALIKWANEHELDAVIWLELTSNFMEEYDRLIQERKEADEESASDFDETPKEFNEKNVLSYFSDIYDYERDRWESARSYFAYVPDQIDTPIRKALRRELSWRNLSEYKHGFWLDKNTFVVADEVEIKKVRKPSMYANQGSTEEDMLILTNAVEMIVDKSGKILGEDRHAHFGLWLDAVNKAIAEHERRSLKST